MSSKRKCPRKNIGRIEVQTQKFFFHSYTTASVWSVITNIAHFQETGIFIMCCHGAVAFTLVSFQLICVPMKTCCLKAPLLVHQKLYLRLSASDPFHLVVARIIQAIVWSMGECWSCKQASSVISSVFWSTPSVIVSMGSFLHPVGYSERQEPVYFSDTSAFDLSQLKC